MLIAGYLSAWIGYYAVPPGPYFQGGNISDRLLNWDSADYLFIAHYGYGAGPIARFSSNFFPFTAIVDRFVYLLVHRWPPAVLNGKGWIVFANYQNATSLSLFLLPSLVAGLASIWVFHSMSLALWNDVWAARISTLAYAAFPGSSYFFTGLAVGLTQLLVILSLRNVLQRRYWRAALYAGLATGFGPLNALVILPVIGFVLINQWRERRESVSVRDISRLIGRVIGIAVVGESGLLSYMLYLWITVGHPLEFVTAEQYWGGHSLVARISGVLSLSDFRIPFLLQVWSSLFFNLPGSPFVSLYLPISDMALLFVVVFALFLWRARLRLPTADRVLLGGFTLTVAAAYTWLIVSQVGVISAPRLTYIAVPCFLAVGSLWRSRRSLAIAVIIFLGVMSCTQLTLLVGGYMLQ